MSDDNQPIEGKAVVKKKVTAKKKATRKKVVKKITKKKVVATSASRKKSVSKKGIKLKAESQDLDSFATHAATAKPSDDSDVSLNAALALNEAELTVSASSEKDIAFKPKPIPEADTLNDQVAETQVSVKASDLNEEAPNKPDEKTVAQAPTEILDISAEPSKDLAVIIKLLIAAGLFLSFSWYVQTVFNDKPNQSSEIVIKEAPITHTEPKINIETVIVENNTSTAESEPVVIDMQKPSPVETNALETDKNLQQITTAPEEISDKTDNSSKAVVTSYPPPPAPAYLAIPFAKQTTKPIPDDQMELIKQTFAPELFK